MASPTAYQNIPGGPPRRRPPPPPPRSPSPEPGPPPALPPRNYGPRKEEAGPRPDAEGERKVDDSKVDFKSVVRLWENTCPRDDAYAAQLRKQDVKFSGLRGSAASTPPSSMSVLHSRATTGISTSYKRQPTLAQEATSPVSSTVVSPLLLSSASSTSSLGPGAASFSHHGKDTPLPAETYSSVSFSSPTKGPLGESPLKGVVDRDSKPVSSVLNSPRPRPLPERGVLPPREQKPVSTRPDQLSPQGEGPLSKDRSVSDFLAKSVDWPFLSPPEVPRDRKVVDSHVLLQQHGRPDSGSASPLKDSSRSPAGKRRDAPLPPLPCNNDPDGVVMDPSHLPPPPPELLNDSGGHFVTEEQKKADLFADDSYGAYRNRGSRQVGTYKRSSSAVLRLDNQHLNAATDAQAMFGDRRLGNQAWNSDSQLQANRKTEVQKGGGSNITSGEPQRPPERPANVSNVQGDSGPVRNAGKAPGQAQLQPSSIPPGQSSGRGRDEGKVFPAQPFPVEQCRAVSEKAVINSHDSSQSSRLAKDRFGSTEKIVSPASSSSSLSPTTSPLHSASSLNSSGQRWANATAFSTTHRVAKDGVKSQSVNAAPGSPRTHRVPDTPRPVVLTQTDSQQPRDRPSGSPPVGSAQNASTSRSRARHGEASPSSDPKHSLRYAEVAPFASDPRGLPGHVRTYSQSSDPSRSTPSPYSRRESAPASHIPPEAIAMVSPRLKSEENLVPDTEKESRAPSEQVLISHGRQRSQEELECDQRAKELAKEVADSEKKLSDVLNTDASKKRMEYLNGIFSGPLDMDVKVPAGVRRHQSHGPGETPSSKLPQNNISSIVTADEDHLDKRKPAPVKQKVSAPNAVIEVEMRKKEEESSGLTTNSHNNTLIKQKEEVMAKLHKKLELLKEERKGLQAEMDDNKALGKRVCDTVDSKCSNPSERDKFHTYITDMEKIVRLMLNLSGQLARAEDAMKALDKDADPEQKKRALEKCKGLRTKYAEAKQLKEHVDKRSDNVLAFLRQSLNGEELNDYTYFVTMKSKLTIHLQQLEDEISLGQEQIQELKKSIAERAPVPEASPPALSPIHMS